MLGQHRPDRLIRRKIRAMLCLNDSATMCIFHPFVESTATCKSPSEHISTLFQFPNFDQQKCYILCETSGIYHQKIIFVKFLALFLTSLVTKCEEWVNNGYLIR